MRQPTTPDSSANSLLDGIDPQESSTVQPTVPMGTDATPLADAPEDVLSAPALATGVNKAEAILEDGWQHSLTMDATRAFVGHEVGEMPEVFGADAKQQYQKDQKASIAKWDWARSQIASNTTTDRIINLGGDAISSLLDPMALVAGDGIGGAVGKVIKTGEGATRAAKIGLTVAKAGVEGTAFTLAGQGVTAVSAPYTGEDASTASFLDNLEKFGLVTAGSHLFSAVLGKAGKLIRKPNPDTAVTLINKDQGLNATGDAANELGAGYKPDQTANTSAALNEAVDQVDAMRENATTPEETPEAKYQLTQDSYDQDIADINEKIADKRAKFDEDIANIVDKTDDPEIAANPIRSYLNMKTAASLVGKMRELKEYLPETKAALEPITKSLDEINTNLGPHKAAKVEDNLPSDLENVNPAEELPALQDSAEKLQDSNPKGYAKRHAEKAEARLNGLRDNEKLADWAKKNNVDDVMDNYLSDMRDLNERMDDLKDNKENDQNVWKAIQNGEQPTNESVRNKMDNIMTGDSDLHNPPTPTSIVKDEKEDAPYREVPKNLEDAKSLVKKFHVEQILDDKDLELVNEVQKQIDASQGDEDFLNETVRCLMGAAPGDLPETHQEKLDKSTRIQGGDHE